MNKWQFSDAANRFEELFERVISDGPQHVFSKQGEVVLLAAQEYDRLTKGNLSFKDYSAAAIRSKILI